jgi:hypothetical protein
MFESIINNKVVQVVLLATTMILVATSTFIAGRATIAKKDLFRRNNTVIKNIVVKNADTYNYAPKPLVIRDTNAV